MKLKPLLPTLRERKRYVVFEVLSKRPLTYAKPIAKAIETSLLSLTGEIGYAKAGLIFLHDKFNKKTQRGIVRVSHTSVDEFIAAMTLTTSVDTEPVLIRTVGVSGIMKKAITKFLA